ncbi:MAG: lamin tail domain-containing protein, partial [Caldilineaceae bacterium]|nr:lamin tail domain-containing protein [Caldilineaceae bacterium]
IGADLFIDAGGYVVLGRNGQSATNGGVTVRYVYTGLSLANSADEILLLRPDGSEADRVLWGGDSGLRVTAGKSLERVTFGPIPVWLTAFAIWPGSADDLGTPGRAFTPPNPTATPTPTLTATMTATSIHTPSPTAASPTATTSATPITTASHTPSSTPTSEPDGSDDPSVFISEFLADPSAVTDANGEWIELHNAGSERVNLKGWTLADLDDDSHTIGADLFIDAGGYVVLGRNGQSATNGGVTVRYVYTGLSLANSADEILLLRPDGSEADRVLWGGDSGLRVTAGKSLERVTFGPIPVWLTAFAAWPGSAGDSGTPGHVFTPSNLTATPSATSTPTLTPTGTTSPAETTTPTASHTPSSTPTSGAGGSGNASLFISEFLADPAAVTDANGEWIELYNAGPDRVNLKGWTLTDLDDDSHTIGADLFIDPDEYVVLGRNGQSATNGGVTIAYVYTGLSLANSADEILLLRPDGSEADRVVWGGDSGLRVTAGKSLERMTFGPVPLWLTALAIWPGSAGDLGTPGTAFAAPNPTATPTSTATPITSTTATASTTTTATPTATASHTPSPTPTATLTVLPAFWPPVATPSALRIDEVAFSGSDGEFVVLINVGRDPLDLTGWVVGDGAIPGGGEGLYELPVGLSLPPGARFVIARNGSAFLARWGEMADAQLESSAAPPPVLKRRRELASGSLALNDSGDELLLLSPALSLADALAYGSGDRALLGLNGQLHPISGQSLHRVPGFAFPDERDQRQRFLWAAPAPFASVALPESLPLDGPVLAEGLHPVWGSLGATSNFTPGGAAPPHYVEAAGAAVGLDFVVVADTVALDEKRIANGRLDGWRWLGAGNSQAVVYGPPFATDGSVDSFLAGLTASSGLAQWIGPGTSPAPIPEVIALAADTLSIPSGLAGLSAKWRNGPLLPAGNSQPPMAGEAVPNPRYTGLAVADRSQGALLDALAARRGWLTNRPGFVLTMQGRAESGQGVWMGSTIRPQATLSLNIHFYDVSGAAAALAIWQNDRPLVQGDLPQSNGIWQVTVPALPGSVLFAVATQADGGFAVTAPLVVENGDGAAVLINEVLPAPAGDHSGDGTIDSNDEFIELYNPGDQAISLAGWWLEDRSSANPARRRFTLGVGHILPPGGLLTVWGSESHIGLNDNGDRLELYDGGGRLADSVEWSAPLARGEGLSRVPDGASWQSRPPSPGQPNPTSSQPEPGQGGSGGGSERLPPWGSGAAPGTPGGEAVGPLRSVTAAKLAGMADVVEFVGVVTVPPGLFNSAIYVADPAPHPNGATAWLGVQVYLRRGDFPPLALGDRVLIRGVMGSFRGEREILVERPEDIWQMESGTPLLPLPVTVADVGERLEGRLISFEGTVTGWQGVSIFLADPAQPDIEPVMVTVRSRLGWRRPYVNKGERWRVIGIVSQAADAPPWNGGYRVLARFPADLVELGGEQ